jgi:hypothetical protein
MMASVGQFAPFFSSYRTPSCLSVLASTYMPIPQHLSPASVPAFPSYDFQQLSVTPPLVFPAPKEDLDRGGAQKEAEEGKETGALSGKRRRRYNECPHTERKHYAKVLQQSKFHTRTCAAIAIINKDGPRRPGSVPIQINLTTLVGNVKAAI